MVIYSNLVENDNNNQIINELVNIMELVLFINSLILFMVSSNRCFSLGIWYMGNSIIKVCSFVIYIFFSINDDNITTRIEYK